MNSTSILFGAPLHREVIPTLQWVEVASSFQIPSFQIIGLPSPEVAEARDRIRSAIEAMGEEFPKRRVVLNLSPASVRKRGTGLDLAMALAILASKAPIDLETSFKVRIVAWGELGLDGRVKPIGQITRTLFASWQAGADFLIISQEDYSMALDALAGIKGSQECSDSPPILVPVENLREAWDLIVSKRILKNEQPELPAREAIHSVHFDHSTLLPLSPALERIVGVAALGSHHLLLLGPKGTGKSHALDWLVALQEQVSPDLRLKTALLEELRNFQSAVGQLSSQKNHFPVRRVGPQVKAPALVGGVTASGVQVGEFSLADGGVLIADELPEWSRDSREALREPLERGKVSLNRIHGSAEMPACFVLAANGNLCPCGGLPAGISKSSVSEGHSDEFVPSACICPERLRKNYLMRLSGPVLDRIDLFFLSVEFPRKNSGGAVDSKSAYDRIKEKINRCGELNRARWGGPAGLITSQRLEELLSENPKWRQEIERIPVSSLRRRHKLLRVALSLSAWDELDQPTAIHFFEASCYRHENYGLF